MKPYLFAACTLLAALSAHPLHAQESSSATTSATTSETGQTLTEEQKNQAKALAQEKAQAWQTLSVAQRQQKRAEMAAKMRERRAAR